MPKVKISEYSSTANSNTDVASINIDEGCAPSGINNAIRAVMGHLKDFQTGAVSDPLTVGGAFTTSSTVTHNGGTANGVAYLNGSKVLTTGSALTFDGASLVGTGKFQSQVSRIKDASYSELYFSTGDTGGNGALSYEHSSNSLRFYTNGSERMRLDASGNLGVGTTSPAKLLEVRGVDAVARFRGSSTQYLDITAVSGGAIKLDASNGNAFTFGQNTAEQMRLDSSGRLLVGTTSSIGTASVGKLQVLGGETFITTNSEVGGFVGVNSNIDNSVAIVADPDSLRSNSHIAFYVDGFSEKARIDSSGNLLFAKSSSSVPTVGIEMLTNGRLIVTSLDQDCLVLNRQSTDGILAEFRHANSTEGNISISGTTVSYNGGHLSRYAQTTAAKDESLLKGTVLSNLDAMNVYTDADGNPVDNEQLNKVKVSDVEGDANVAGVFVNWSHDEAHDVDEINMAMTGDMIIRIAQGTTVQRGDLLMSAGNGTAKPQGDDIVRSKTVAKVTSTHITCTYEDGSYCVPCVLMAC